LVADGRFFALFSCDDFSVLTRIKSPAFLAKIFEAVAVPWCSSVSSVDYLHFLCVLCSLCGQKRFCFWFLLKAKDKALMPLLPFIPRESVFAGDDGQLVGWRHSWFACHQLFS